MEQIRPLNERDLTDHYALTTFAFQLAPGEVETRKQRDDPNQMFGYFVDGQLAAKMTILPLSVWIAGKPFALGGVASVATWPEHRRHGMVGQLLQHSLRVMRERGQTLSFLHPFSFAFYRKYGWETYVDRKTYVIDVRQLPPFRDASGHVVQTEDTALIAQLYTAYARRYTGTLIRDESWWEQRVFGNRQGRRVVYYNDSGQPEGYLFYQVLQRQLTVHELVFLTEAARRGLWKFIFQHDSMVDQVKLLAPMDDLLAFLLDEPGIKQEIAPYFMARIVDVKGFLEQFPFIPYSESLHCILRVADAHAPWNHESFVIDLSKDGTARVGLPHNEPDLPVLSCSIQTLTTMMMGYVRPESLYQLERLQGDAELAAQLGARIPNVTPYLMDYF